MNKMNTRKVIVKVFSSPAYFYKTSSFKRLCLIPEVLDYVSVFNSSDTLEDILVTYIDKVSVCASFVSDIRFYRIVLKDNERFIQKLHKA